jgi:cGMP-dependent protein kinase
MQKAQIVACHQERNIMNEKHILSSCKHPFILELLGTLKDDNQIYMLMELVQGGELWVYIYDRFDLLPRTKIGGFQQEHAKFYAGCVISAFQYIHSKGVAYRDLKPENLLMDVHGYLKVIDFGFAKAIPFEKNCVLQPKSFTLCGTPEYLAPELVLSRGHDKSVDYWALGCLLYELLVGRTPFQDEQQDEIFKKIINSQKYLTFPRGLDNASVDLIKALMNPNPAFRLGNLLGGPTEIMEHAFFAGLDWTQLQAKALPAPYQPSIRDPMDVSNFDSYPEDEELVHYTGAQSIFDQF